MVTVRQKVIPSLQRITSEQRTNQNVEVGPRQAGVSAALGKGGEQPQHAGFLHDAPGSSRTGEVYTAASLQALKQREVAPRNNVLGVLLANQASTKSEHDAIMADLASAADPGHVANAISRAKAFLASPAGQQLSAAEKAELTAAITGARAEQHVDAGLVDTEVGPIERPSGVDARYRVGQDREQGVDRVARAGGGADATSPEAELRWTAARLSVTDTETGARSTLAKNSADIEEIRAAFREDGALGHADWFATTEFASAGGAGRLVSVARSDSSYTGGAHGSAQSQYATFDAATGERVRLDQLVEGEQLEHVLAATRLAMRRHPAGDAYLGAMDDGAFREAALSSFAVFVDEGRPKIAIGVPPSMGAGGGTLLEAVVDAPTSSPALLQAMGLADNLVAR